jgi:Ser/Thr protein kinase RdoA (MazF antagonist)
MSQKRNERVRQKVGEGETAEVFVFEEGKVVKLFKEGFYTEEDFEREFELTKFLGETTDFVPIVYGKTMIENRHGYIMEEVKGILYQKIIEEDIEHIYHHGERLGKLHKQLHQKSVKDFMYKITNFEDFMRPFVEKTKLFDDSVKQWLIILLESLADDDAVLLHGDFMPYNIIEADQQLKVIDWAEPCIGPSIAGVTRTINFIYDWTDEQYNYTNNESKQMIQGYLNGYGIDEIDNELMNAGFLINAVSEYAWAVHSKQEDDYSQFLYELVLKNYNRYLEGLPYNVFDELYSL